VLSLDSVDHALCPPTPSRRALHAVALLVPDSDHRKRPPLRDSVCPPRDKARSRYAYSRKRKPAASGHHAAHHGGLLERNENGVAADDAARADETMEANAADAAAAAAADTVRAALPPSCLAVLAGTVSGTVSRAVSGAPAGGGCLVAALLTGALLSLEHALEERRFAPVEAEAKEAAHAEDAEARAAPLDGTPLLQLDKRRLKGKQAPKGRASPPSFSSAERLSSLILSDKGGSGSNNNSKERSGRAGGGGSGGSSSNNSSRERSAFGDVARLAAVPPMAMAPDQYGDADQGQGFVVRGPTFTEDRVKVAASPALFDLVAVDLWRVEEPIPHIAAQPSNRVALAHARGDSPPWVFVLQIQVPGPPHFAFVAYFVPRDPGCLRDGSTPFGRIADPFFFGTDDDFRDDRFKLIPRVVEGNFIVRNAVGAKPTILGRKLKQSYHRGPNYFELDIDVASSTIAQKVVGIAYGYAKLLTVDLALVLQGEAVDELPEVPFGAVRLVGVDFNAAAKHPPAVAPSRPESAANGGADTRA